MGLITRHVGVPFQDGETLAGADLEGDIAACFGAINGNIDTVNIKNNAVTTAKIADGSVTQAKLDGTLVATVADDGVSTIKIQDEAVTEAKIADDAVTEDKIADGAVTQAKFADGAAHTYQKSFSHTTVALTTSFVQQAAAVHPTGAPADMVVIIVSFTIVGAAPVVYGVEKDTISLLGIANYDTMVMPGASGSTEYQVTRMYVDTSPTSSLSHTYRLMMKYTAGGGAVASIKDLSFVVYEPRS